MVKTGGYVSFTKKVFFLDKNIIYVTTEALTYMKNDSVHNFVWSKAVSRHLTCQTGEIEKENVPKTLISS